MSLNVVAYIVTVDYPKCRYLEMSQLLAQIPRLCILLHLKKENHTIIQDVLLCFIITSFFFFCRETITTTTDIATFVKLKG